MARGGIPPSPLRPRHGVDAQRYRMPQSGPWATLRDHLVERLAPHLGAADVDRMLAAGEFVDAAGVPVPPDAPFVPRSAVWAHRDLPDEPHVPFDVDILHRDERLVVVDKPHHLSTMPRGRHVAQSALARTRVLTGIDRLSPAHRLDRPTAGVLMFTTEPRWRGPYQRAFADGLVHKEYLAVAPVRPGLRLPLVRRTHLVKEHGTHQAREVPGMPPNAETLVELEAVSGDLGLYRLTPRTGRTHQLRCQLNGLGIPIVDDPLYPVEHDREPGDFSAPLQLLAAVLAFRDPVDGSPRRFVSRRRLESWPGTWPGAWPGAWSGNAARNAAHRAAHRAAPQQRTEQPTEQPTEHP